MGILASVFKAEGVKDKRFILASKAHPSQKNGLSTTGLREQLETSLKTMEISKLDVFYLHQPDPEHDLKETVECLQALIKEGKIKKYALSNYSAVETQRLLDLCKENKWRRPSFF